MFWTDRELHLGFQALDFVGLAQIHPKYSLAKVQSHSPQQSPATLCPLWKNLENLETWEVAGLFPPPSMDLF